jgi:hypothetical protein
MSLVLPSRSRSGDARVAPTLHTLLLWAAFLGWLGCGGGGTDIILPSLSVTTSTAGTELDPDGYSLAVDDQAGQPIGLNGNVVIDRLADGAHSVALSGLATNCVTDGDNPRTVTVQSGSTANVTFAITCSATSGSIAVSTATSGPGSDPDGFDLLLDGTERGPIAPGATLSLSGLAPGPHTLGLTGLAANCQVAGENPRSLTVLPGETSPVSFAVTCGMPATSAGTLEITTSTSGSNPDPDGYSVAVDGTSSQPIAINATLALPNISAAQHSVRLLGVAANCTISGSNPKQTTVATGGTARVAFTVTCAAAPGTGSVRITTATSGGSPDPDGYTIAIDQGNPLPISINDSRTVEGLSVGSHSVQLSGLAGNCSVSGENPRPVTVASGQTATVAFAVTCVAGGPSINLRIDRMYLTQSVQRPAGDVPLVQGRDGFLRVFVTAGTSNSAQPKVRVRFFQNGASTPGGTFTISAPGNSTPTAVREEPLGSSWNVRVPGSLIRPNTAVLAEVDPEGAVSEANETDNRFPVSGTPRPLDVRAVSLARIRFVRVLQTANGLQGDFGSTTDLVELARKMYPLNGIQTDVRSSVFTASGPLQPGDENGQWGQILGDLEAARLAEAPDLIYFGVVKLGYTIGLHGQTFPFRAGEPLTATSLGWDEPTDVRAVVAHELGHVWGQSHSPCGGAPNPDPNYPYASGSIGVYGMDVGAGSLKPPSTPNIMGWCLNPWVSDYTYERILNFRESHPLPSAASLALKQPSLLVWGQIVDGRPVLEPAFQVVTRPALPLKPGPYSVSGIAADGTSLFNLSFDAAPAADEPAGSRRFAFAVPLGPSGAARLASLRVAGPGGAVATMSQSVARLHPGMASDSIIARREAGAVTLEWNAAAHPMIMVRDPDSGEVLSFGRGGKAWVTTSKAAVDLDVSNGLNSHRVRLAINRP